MQGTFLNYMVMMHDDIGHHHGSDISQACEKSVQLNVFNGMIKWATMLSGTLKLPSHASWPG